MKIAVIGTGYVGLVTGTCFANSGNEVICVDIDVDKIDALQQGKIPIFEPGLEQLVSYNLAAERLMFSTDLAKGVSSAEIVFLAVGTPQGEDGTADLSALWTVVNGIAPHLQEAAIVVTKSTVPVGTNARIFAQLEELTGRQCFVASNPEFLKEALRSKTSRSPIVWSLGSENHLPLKYCDSFMNPICEPSIRSWS